MFRVATLLHLWYSLSLHVGWNVFSIRVSVSTPLCTVHLAHPASPRVTILPFPFIFPSHSLALIPGPPPSAPCRLLKVKPEERLTIEGVLAHPWLNCTEALDNVLPSAQMMMDKVRGTLTDACGRS